MPKEIISTQPDMPFVQVGWQRDLNLVQIATLEPGDMDERSGERSGYFASLDRAGINRLIRSLRKARDQAFGADA